MRHIKVFVSSSLRHEEARAIIQTTFDGIYTPRPDAPDEEKVEFRTYVHETNGTNGIINRVSSQKLIDAEVEDHNVFILYAGDVVGDMTVQEFEKALKSPEFNVKFIYVLHNESDILTQKSNDIRYWTWDEFYSTHMKDLGKEYYEIFTGMDTLRDKVANIRRQLAERQLVPLSPLDMDYPMMISGSQKDYRRFTTYLNRGDLDNDLMEALEFNPDDGPLPLLTVTGQSLAGKTRAVVNALGRLDPSQVKIHYLRGFDPRTEEIFRSINPESQFHEGWHHILFIDEIDNLIFNETKFASLAPKFFALCDFALAHPQRLRIVGTSATDFGALRALLAGPSSQAPWLRLTRNIDISSMSRKDLASVVRRLRVLNLFAAEDMRKIKDGMPLGALFVDLTKLKNRFSVFYPTQPGAPVTRDMLFARCVFDAVKSIVLWKNSPSIDPMLLLHFLNNAYGLKGRGGKDFFTEESVENFLSGQKDFISIYSTSLADYEYRVDDVIADEVLMFCDDNQQPADHETALRRIIHYIITHHPDEKFEDLSKLIHRTYARTGDLSLTDIVVSEVLGHYSIADIADARELTPTIDGDAKNWAQVMLNRIAHYLLRHESFDRVLELFNDTGSDGVLSILVENASAKREKDLVNAILFHPDGTLKEKYVNTTDKKLLENIFNLLDFNAAFDLFCSIDIDRLVSANHRQVRNEQIYIDESLRHTASLYFSLLLQKVENFTDFDTAFSILEARNAVRIQEGKTPFYRSDFERYFLFPKKYAWKLLSENITSHDLRKVFTAIYATPLPEGTSPADDISLTRTEIFNYLLDQMDLDQALPTWEDMRNVRDSFSLVQILGKAPDFSIAKGLMDSFISGGVGKHVRIGIRAVNALLATTQDISDATECVKYFRSIGYLPASTDPGVPDCFADLLDIDDMYTQGILAARDFIGFNSRCRILRRHVNPSVVRNEGTLTHVVYKAPGFEAAEEILFGTPDFITSDEQKLLRNSPVALSWLAGRTFSSDRKDDLDRRIHQVIQTARGEDSLQDIFDPSTANIINEYIGNRNLTPTYEDALTAIDRFTAELGFSPANDFTCTKLMWRYVEADRPREEKIRRVNEHVLSQSHMRRSHVRQNTLLRYLLADRRKSYPAVSLTHTEAYPFVESTGEWTLREITTVDYVRNMMDHRFLHPLALFYALKGLLDNILAGKDRDRNISVFKDLVERARKNRIFITQRLIVSLLDKMAGVRGLDIDLRPIAGDYSIIQDLCDRLESGAITPRRAMAELESYRQRHPIGIYIPAKFYNRIAQSLAKDERLTVTDHLDIFRTRDGLSSFTVCPLMHAVRSFDEYLSVKELWGKPLLPMFYKAFPSVLQKMSEAGSQNEADLIIRDCLGWDGYRFTTPVPIANTLAIRIAGFWSEKDAATLIGIFARSGYCDSTDTTAAPENDADNYDDLDDTPEETYDSTSQQLLLRPRTPEELIAILEYAAIHSENIKASFLLNRLMETRPSSVQAERIVDLITGGGIPGVQKNNFHFVLLAVKNWGFDIGMLRGLIDRCSIVLDSSDFYSALHIIDTLDDYLFLRGHYTGTFQSRHCDMIMKRINHRSGEKAVFRHDLFGHFNTPDHIAIFSRLAAADPRLRRAIERNHTLNYRRRDPHMKEFCNFCAAILTTAT